jgi:hypothetical protein
MSLSWLTNTALVYEPKCGGGGVAESQPLSTAVHRSPNKLWRSNSIFNLWHRSFIRPLIMETVVSSCTSVDSMVTLYNTYYFIITAVLLDKGMPKISPRFFAV